MTTWQLHSTLMRYRRGLYFVNCAIWGTHAILPLGIGLAIRAFFDALSGSSPAGMNAWTALALVAACWFGRVVTLVVGAWSFASVWQSIATLLTRNLMEWLVIEPGTRRLPDAPGEVVNRFRDDIHEILMYLDNWVDLFGVTLFVSIGLTIMFAISATATLVVLVPLAIVLILANRLGARLRRYRRLNREATGRVTDFVGETFNAVQAVAVASAERRVIRRFEQLNAVRRQAALKDRLFDELLDSVSGNMSAVATGGVLLLIATSSAQLTVGDFALFASYTGRMAGWIQFLGQMMARHKRVRVSYDRLIEILEGEPPRRLVRAAPIHLEADPPPAPTPALVPSDRLQRLELRGLTYQHPTTGRGIAAIDLTLERGTLTVITGRVGSGKTTLLRVLLGLLPTGDGEIRWNGRLVTDPGAFFVPPRAAYTPQVPRLFSESLRDNVLMGASEDALAAALRVAVMEHDLTTFPEGLASLVGPRGVRLSGGQVQRTAAARMLVRAPELLVFDDLSSALDVETERQLWERLFADRGDVTCLVVSHREAVLQRADQVVVLEDGRLQSAPCNRPTSPSSLERATTSPAGTPRSFSRPS